MKILTTLVLMLQINSFGMINNFPSYEAETIDSIISRYLNNNSAGCVALVAKNGEAIFSSAYGLSNVEKKEYLSTGSTLPLGSVSKQFTAMAIHILANEGKLNLDDDLTQFFPNIPNFEGATIRHLLTHTSGVIDYFQIAEWNNDLSREIKPNEVPALLSGHKTNFKSGEKVEYSNSGYHLLGLIIEKVYGSTYNDFIRSKIFEPLGMSNSFFIDDLGAIKKLPLGYIKRNNNLLKPGNVHSSRFFAGGSIISSVKDMLIWDNALYSSTLLSDERLKEYFREFILNNNESSAMSCGWEVLTLNGKKLYGHGGGINGHVSQVYRYPAENIYIAILSNVVNKDSDFSIAQIAQEILSIVVPSNDSTYNSEILAKIDFNKYVGKYLLPDGSVREIFVSDGKLFYRVGEKRTVELHPQSTLTFTAGKASKIVFRIDDAGKITGLEIFTGRGRTITAEKF